MQSPPLIHFYSPATGVSLELPVGFEPGPQTDTGATYLARDSDDEQVLASVVVSVVARALDTGADAAAALDAAVDATATAIATAAASVLDRREQWVDDTRVITLVTTPPSGADDLVQLSVVGFGGAVRTIAATAPLPQRSRWEPVFEGMVASCRFI